MHLPPVIRCCNHHTGDCPVQVSYPKRTDKPLYHGLVKQLESLHIPFVDPEEVLSTSLQDSYDVVVDSMFGFGFKGPPRPPFEAILERLKYGKFPLHSPTSSFKSKLAKDQID